MMQPTENTEDKKINLGWRVSAELKERFILEAVRRRLSYEKAVEEAMGMWLGVEHEPARFQTSERTLLAFDRFCSRPKGKIDRHYRDALVETLQERYMEDE